MGWGMEDGGWGMRLTQCAASVAVTALTVACSSPPPTTPQPLLPAAPTVEAPPSPPPPAPPAATARYRVTFQSTWSRDSHPVVIHRLLGRPVASGGTVPPFGTFTFVRQQ
jgi:hypothetical protein